MSSFLENRYKTLFMIAKIVEVIGWLLCLTIIFIPFGLAMVLYAQTVLVFVSTEDNTRRSLVALERIATALSTGGVSAGLQQVAGTTALQVGTGVGLTAKMPPTAARCPGCGDPITTADAFCGTCGQTLPSSGGAGRSLSSSS